ncbi:hypothetical protein E3V55_00120 [Candidatus Marinimicrobia bacterium MT.SAG.3]|nr:hypothetical protein E3V55_00120 [Candidatus Marinimicrobia bacterium MT.SAG.3]
MNGLLNIALHWNFHQPQYADPEDRANSQPWVRLHAVREYLDLGLMMQKFPNVKSTITMSSCLIDQLQQYENGFEDSFLSLLKLNPQDMNEEIKSAFLPKIFDIYASDSMLEKAEWSKVYETWNKRVKNGGLEKAANLTTDQEILDIQTLFLLGWSGNSLLNSAELEKITMKESGFTVEEKIVVLDLHEQLLPKIIPLYKELASTEQVELSISPYYHPILPLLIDNDYGKIADRYCEESSLHFEFPSDAEKQVRDAFKLHEKVFEEKPLGMLPPEGSVCFEVIELCSREGLKWLTTGEQVLLRSVEGELDAEKKFRAYNVEGVENSPAVFFRCQELSESIVTEYFDISPKSAVDDLFNKFAIIRDSISGDHKKYIVPILLDVENSWEFFPENGMPFLNELYSRLSDSEMVKTVTMKDYLEEAGELPVIYNIQPGSIIDGNFNSWIGQEQKNRAWDVLTEARKALEKAGEQDDIKKEPFKGRYEAAYRNILASEGSDWFWWYGKRRSLPRGRLFDELYRSHLIKVYSYLNLSIPEELLKPLDYYVEEGAAAPEAMLTPDVDGKETEAGEWDAAGYWYLEEVAGRQAEYIFSGVKYGFDKENLYLRLDGDSGLLRSTEEKVAIDICIVKPVEAVITVSLTDQLEIIKYKSQGVIRDITGGEMNLQDLIEVKLPLSEIGLGMNEKFYFFVRLTYKGEELERLPRQGVIKTVTPSEERKTKRWYH